MFCEFQSGKGSVNIARSDVSRCLYARRHCETHDFSLFNCIYLHTKALMTYYEQYWVSCRLFPSFSQPIDILNVIQLGGKRFKAQLLHRKHLFTFILLLLTDETAAKVVFNVKPSLQLWEVKCSLNKNLPGRSFIPTVSQKKKYHQGISFIHSVNISNDHNCRLVNTGNRIDHQRLWQDF